MIDLILILFSLLGLTIGAKLYGESVTKQFEAGMFVGFGLGCALIVVVRIFV